MLFITNTMHRGYSPCCQFAMCLLLHMCKQSYGLFNEQTLVLVYIKKKNPFRSVLWNVSVVLEISIKAKVSTVVNETGLLSTHCSHPNSLFTLIRKLVRSIYSAKILRYLKVSVLSFNLVILSYAYEATKKNKSSFTLGPSSQKGLSQFHVIEIAGVCYSFTT